MGYDSYLGVKPASMVNPQWFVSVVLTCAFILRRYILKSLTRRLYGHLPEQKQIKVANYMLELLGTTFVLVIMSMKGFWGAVFVPSHYDPPTPNQAYDFGVGCNVMLATFISMYMLELAFDANMRFSLTLHHWVSIVLTLWAIPTIYYNGNSVYTIRALFVLSLYMSTEQNVFVEMLCYQLQMYSCPWLYYISACYYALTRPVIMVASMWTWWEMRVVVIQEEYDQRAFVFALWLFIPAANLILNATQVSTVVSLFGIAGVVRRTRERNMGVDIHSDLKNGVQVSECAGGDASVPQATPPTTSPVPESMAHISTGDDAISNNV